ncbi:SulP family inorganic anion transporter [Desulfovibrio litoralis]|uniref:STAS domain-containing protein n=1 Tax=Desulfovibrio litoralis DSM 11393 TaxID=1121455 RepID=A0A1M7TDM5_9BACT|nr:SulP family inorganic anion transporter [Desulfovibrio litoralis]SHN68777.1 STAS domain-containing protein [Desulfovibrio litoralis DSM 11393]
MQLINKKGFPFTPFLPWLKTYNMRLFKADFIAGLSLSLLMAPQAMANAQLAGLPAYHGLYASILPGFIGALFGSSRQLVTMPVAVISLLSAAAISPLATLGTSGFITYITLLTFLVGIIQLSLGLLRLGILVNFLSYPVLEGFTNAAAVLIGFSQVGKLLGIQVEPATRQMETLLKTLHVALSYVHIPTVTIAVSTLAILYFSKKFVRFLPDVLVAVIITSLFSWAFAYEKKEVVAIEQIKSEQAHALINSLTTIHIATEKLNVAKEKLQENLNKQPNTLDESAKNELLYELSKVKTELERYKNDATLKKDALRLMHFRELAEKENTSFYPKDQLPPNADYGWRVWQIRVNAINFNEPDKIPFDGGGEVIGYIPSGLPPLVLPSFDLNMILQLFSSACIIAFISFANSISMAKTMANKRGYTIDSNQELVGQGLANIAGGLSLAPPCSGSYSASAANFLGGAYTSVSTMTASLCILLMLFVLTPFLYYLPVAALSMVIFISVVKSVNIEAVLKIWTARWYDGVISILTFVSTLYFAPHLEMGILIGVVLTISISFYRTMHPKIIRLSCGPDLVARDAEYHQLAECEHILALYFQQDLIYSNASVLEEKILERMDAMPKLKHLHLQCNGMNDIDASGAETLLNIITMLHKSNISVSLSGLTGEVADVVSRTGLLAKIGPGNIFRGLKDAICTVHRRLHPNGIYCKSCPWNGYCNIPAKQCTSVCGLDT